MESITIFPVFKSQEIFTYTSGMARPLCGVCGARVDVPDDVADPTVPWVGFCTAGHTATFMLDDEETETGDKSNDEPDDDEFNHRDLLARWMDLSEQKDSPDQQASLAVLMEATRAALARESRVVVLVDGGNVQGIWADQPGVDVVMVDRDNERAGDDEIDLDDAVVGLDAIY